MLRIPKQNYIRRRNELAKRAQVDMIVVTGTDLVQKSSDETYEFEQDGYFYYLTGIEEHGWILVIDTVVGSEFLISTDESSYHSDVWDEKYSPQDIADLCGIADIRSARDGWGYIRREAKNYQAIGSIVPSERFIKSFGMYIHPSKITLVQRLRRIHKDANLVDIGLHIRRMRSVKEPEEVAHIRAAIDTTAKGLQIISAKLDQYDDEAEVYADLTYSFMSQRSRHGYVPVIASGKNSAKLHYKANIAPIKNNAVLLIDVGASSGRYMADISRTYRIGRLPDQHQAIWQAVRDVQVEFFNFLKPGVTMLEYEHFAERTLGKVLLDLGIIKTRLRKHIREYYPHAIGHHLGIDVHDSCTYDEPLQPGAVITCEPGIYIADQAIGVRIEDDVLITDDGAEVLSDHIPRD